jgi:hypothetical protein
LLILGVTLLAVPLGAWAPIVTWEEICKTDPSDWQACRIADLSTRVSLKQFDQSELKPSPEMLRGFRAHTQLEQRRIEYQSTCTLIADRNPTGELAELLRLTNMTLIDRTKFDKCWSQSLEGERQQARRDSIALIMRIGAALGFLIVLWYRRPIWRTVKRGLSFVSRQGAL